MLTLVWSEFGRRAEENGSTEPTTAPPESGSSWARACNGTMIGEFPGLKDGLDDDGNLKATVDYRAIYASVLEQWLGTDAAADRSRSAASFGRVPLLR